jgi:glycosyltransferase involved in cell wall biosynthesis
MRIALISEHASPLSALGGVDAGGQNTHVAELATALARNGHQVTVYTRRDDPQQPERVPVGSGVAVVHVPAGPPHRLPKDDLLPYMGEFGIWLANHWSAAGQERPDVVHAHFWMSGLAALAAADHTRLPVTLTYHALGSVKRRHLGSHDTSPPLRVGYERMLGRRVDRVIAQCRDEVEELSRLRVPRRRITVVPSGVDSTLFVPDGPAAVRTGRPRVITVGRLVPRKGFQDVIRAMRWVPGAECLIVGGPPGRAAAEDPFGRRLLELARRAGVEDRVRLVGAVPREEMPGWYRSADLMVTAPWYEPFGLTPLEAMACGVPVVATAVGGLRDTVVDGVTGVLVRPRDPAGLGHAIRRLLADPGRRLGLSAAAVDRACSRYSWERAADQLTAVYRSVAGVPSGAVA